MERRHTRQHPYLARQLCLDGAKVEGAFHGSLDLHEVLLLEDLVRRTRRFHGLANTHIHAVVLR